jgi:hypothetical protein
MEKLKYTQLLDFIVRILKDGKTLKPTGYVSLVALLRAIKHLNSFGEVLEIGKYLETMGWVKATYPLGDVRLQITPSGIVYIESKDKEFEKEYLKFTEGLIDEYPKGEFPSVPIIDEKDNIDPKKAIFDLLDAILVKVKTIQGEDGDLYKDAKVIKVELSKLSPDLRMIEIKINNLKVLDAIRDDVQELKNYLDVPDYIS